MSRLTPFLQTLEAGHPFARTRDLESSLDAEAILALRAAGILRPASPVETVPCDDPKKMCFRRVAVAPEGHEAPFIGACKEARGACAPRPVDAQEIAQEEISAPDVVRALRALYELETRGLPVATSFAEPKPVHLGWQAAPRGKAGEARKVVLVPRPSFGLTLTLLASIRTLVLVPTARALSPAQRAKHAPGSFVAIEVLEETLTVNGGLLARGDGGARAPEVSGRVAAPARVAKSDEDAPPPAASDPASVDKAPRGRPLFPGAKHWRDVRFCLIDGTTVRIDVAGKSYRRTYVDLGMANARNRNPTKEWRLLVAACEGRGSFQWRPFGQHPAAAKVVSRLRARLKSLFGISEPPFATFSYHHGWRARFVALPELPVELGRPNYRR